MDREQPFNELVDVYESLVDWPRRLASEEPFYRRLFEEATVQRVLDTACGTGHHAAMFQRWGLTVEGADISAEMIRRAELRHGRSANLQWSTRSFDHPVPADQSYDAAICIGNSLALAGDFSIAETALGCMFEAIRPGGLIVVQVLNLWRLSDGPCLWQKCCRVNLASPQREVLVTKGIHRCGRSGYVNLIITDYEHSKFVKTESVPLLGFEADQIADLARGAGADSIEFFGDYKAQPYQREESIDLILVARKQK